MDFESIRPIVSGLLGGAVSVWLFSKLSKSVPETYGAKRVEELVQENKSKILISNILFFTSIFGGVVLYQIGYLERNDWRGFLLLVGLAMVSPLLFLLLASVRGGGQGIKEALVAYAIAQRVPLSVLYGCFALGTICLFAALGSMIGA